MVGLKNSGNEPILASDFAQPIDIEIQGRGRILSATVNKQKPENLGLKIVVEDWNIKLEPTLWNPGDYATVKVLFAGTSPGPKIHVRIAGIEEVVPLNRGLRFGPREKREFAVDLIKVAAFGVVATVAASRTGASDQAMAWLVAIYCGFVIAIATWAITQGKLTNSQRRYIDDA